MGLCAKLNWFYNGAKKKDEIDPVLSFWAETFLLHNILLLQNDNCKWEKSGSKTQITETLKKTKHEENSDSTLKKIAPI